MLRSADMPFRHMFRFEMFRFAQHDTVWPVILNERQRSEESRSPHHLFAANVSCRAPSIRPFVYSGIIRIFASEAEVRRLTLKPHMQTIMTLTPMFLGNLGATEIILILLIIVLLFGGRKIPELMRGLGRGMKEFKDAATKDYSSESGDKSKSVASGDSRQRRRRPQRRRKPAGSSADSGEKASATPAPEKPKSEESPKREGARKPRRKPAADNGGDAQPSAQPAQEGAVKPHRPRRRPRKPAEPKMNE